MIEPVRFTVRFHQTMSADGKIFGTLPAADQLIAFYRMMHLTRSFDQQAIALQRTGRLGTYASSLGQEAVATAIGFAMQPDDVLAPTYREHGAHIVRGISISEMLQYWGGDERGMACRQAKEDLPVCVPIATHCCHAAGVAYAMKLRQQRRAAVCVLGDGASSKGDFYEAMNAAGVWQLPLVFVINNNQWAISHRRDQQSAAQTLAQKAIAAGIDCEQVDGNDVVGCYQRMERAVSAARNGQGPYLLEALSYRLSDHTTADDASRYRSEKEVKKQWQYDPLLRLKRYLIAQGILTEQALMDLIQQCDEHLAQQVQQYLDTADPEPVSMFDYLYANMPASLARQRQTLLARYQEGDDG